MKFDFRDANDALGYMVSQLAYVEKQVYVVKRRPILFEQLVSVTTEAGEHATSVEVHFLDGATKGRFLGGSASDIPYVRAQTGRFSIALIPGGIGYIVGLEELRQSKFLGRDLNTSLASLSLRGFQEHAQEVALLGDSARNFAGLLNSADVTAVNAATTLAAAASPEAMADIVNTGLSAVFSGTKTIERVNTVLLPPTQFALLATTNISANAQTTVLEYLKKSNVFTAEMNIPLEFRAVSELEGIGAGATDRMMVYDNNIDIVKMHIPMPHRFIAPQMDGLEIKVPGEYKLGGVEWLYPGAARYIDGV